MTDEIEREDQKRLEQIASASGWPTIAALMHERDA
jgi:hypothetical protein